tara:strand:- start:495 stop:2735 length:2241 start_codon:yes stop_codon:yes gene_type:complete
MIPTNSSSSTNGCDNISSNCVIWQGPDISCIDLCNGDSISEVVAKLATKLCDIITNGVTANPNLSGLDLTCLNIPGVTPTELVPVLQAMVVQICLNTSPTSVGNKSGSILPAKTQVQDDLPIMTLPACMLYDDANGNPVTELRLDLFASLIANQVCTNLTSINIINSTLTNISGRLLILEACVLPCTGVVAETQVIPTCVMPSVLTNVSVLLLAVEARFCLLETAVGLPSAILATIQQTFIVNSTPQLTNPGSNYGSIAGWNSSPSNLAQSVQNAWAVIDDMYTAIASIQLNCCPTGCDAVIFNYITSNNLSSTGQIASVTFDFMASIIPASFNDCAGSSIITITDSAGLSVSTTVSVSSLQSEPLGIAIPVPTLNTSQDLSTSVSFCVTDGVDTCSATQSSIIPGIVPCPAPVTVSLITQTTASIYFNNLIGATATYTVNVRNPQNIIEFTSTINNPGGTLTVPVTGLIPGRVYTVDIVVSLDGAVQACEISASFTTTSAVAACSTGMDVAFVVDYGSTMATIVEEIKTGASAIISKITSASGASDYRLGLILADEGVVNIPTYNTSTEYVALPVGQRVINTGTADYQYITAVEMFQTNNTATFTTQLNKINTGAPVAGWPIGSGSGAPQPVDMAIGLVVEANALLGAFRAGVAKNLLIYTDNLPSGSDDAFDETDVARMNSLATTCAVNGIRCIVVGAGVDLTYTPAGGVATYPWRIFATATGGGYNVSYSAGTVIDLINTGCA